MFSKRTLLAALTALTFCAPAFAQTYPSKIIKIIAPYTPGSPNDVMVRLLAQHAQQRLGQPIIIDNRPGGGTSIGTKVAAASAPDGYTLLFISSALVTDPAMRGIDYDPMKDFTPVAAVTTTSWLFAVVPSLPVKTMKEFIAYTKANPGTVMLGYAQGTAAVLLGERYKQLSGADITSIPYKGGAAAMPDFLGGRIQMLVPTPSTTLGLIREGKMRILGITSGQRSTDLPDVPTVKELGLPDLELYFWAGVLAPAGTPPEIVAKLNAAINDSLRSDEMKAAMTKLGFDAKIGSPQDFAAFIGEETPRWRAIVKATGVKLE
ncbi:MAG: tripartite tricarboxylate transporter substrate binding protein [Pseudomonadota bacterium]